MSKCILLWFVTVSWLFMIFSFSAQPATNSAELSMKVAKKIVQGTTVSHRTMETEVESTARSMHAEVRKLAHFFLYLVLGILSLHLCLCYTGSFWKAAGISFLGSALYGLSDEVHQIFVTGRGFMVSDVLLDSFSALVGICFVWLWYFTLKKLKKN